MQGYAPEAAATVFDRSRAMFAAMIDVLAGPHARQWNHAELEERVLEDGRELLRLMYQDHLELRAREEDRLAVVTGADAVAHTRVECGHSRAVTTVFGTVTVERMAYRAPGAANLYPADATLNLPTEKHAHGLRRLAAIEATRGSFDDATAAIDRATGVRLGKRQAEALARAAAMDVEAFYAAGRPQPAPVHRALVLTVDGKGIVMRPEALREATAKAAAAKGTKPATRLSPGEKAGRKPMAEVGAV